MELRILIDNRGKQFTGFSRDKLGLTLMALPICLERIFICSITLIMLYNARFSSFF